MRVRLAFLMMLMGVSVAACNLGTDEEDLPTPTPTTLAAGAPTVSITSPQQGDEFNVNAEIPITATASDEVGVTRMQLIVNNRVIRTITSDVEGGERQKNVIFDYTPTSTGEVTLRVVAYRNNTTSDPAEVTVMVVGSSAQPTSTTSGGGSSLPPIDPNDPTCRARVDTGLNLRTGPSTSYDVIRLLTVGEVLPITGRLGDNSWWQVRSGATFGWISAQFVTNFGNCLNIPLVAPPASPTAPGQPSNTPVPATATTAPTVTTAPPTAVPLPADLSINRVTGPDSVEIPVGSDTATAIYNVVVSNTGGLRSGQFTLEVDILNYDVEPVEVSVGNLREGESAAFDVTVTFRRQGAAPVTTPVFVQAEADIFDEVDEQSEANNTGQKTVNQVER